MATKNAITTVEQDASYLAALEAERNGYAVRLAAKKVGAGLGVGSDLSVEQLSGRIEQVDAEIKRVQPAKRPPRS